jgi:aminoglycoside phosphotransferase (APT) family kinase protein
LPSRYADLLCQELPLEDDEIRQLHAFEPRFRRLCDELAACGIPETVQHDDLHYANLCLQGEQPRILDWGDSSISHPFASLVVTFRFLEEFIGCQRATRGMRGCATCTSSRGVQVS